MAKRTRGTRFPSLFLSLSHPRSPRRTRWDETQDGPCVKGEGVEMWDGGALRSLAPAGAFLALAPSLAPSRPPPPPRIGSPVTHRLGVAVRTAVRRAAAIVACVSERGGERRED